MGVITAPEMGSGSWPAWMQSVSSEGPESLASCVMTASTIGSGRACGEGQRTEALATEPRTLFPAA